VHLIITTRFMVSVYVRIDIFSHMAHEAWELHVVPLGYEPNPEPVLRTRDSGAQPPRAPSLAPPLRSRSYSLTRHEVLSVSQLSNACTVYRCTFGKCTSLLGPASRLLSLVSLQISFLRSKPTASVLLPLFDTLTPRPIPGPMWSGTVEHLS
jgi:hypothetical protein